VSGAELTGIVLAVAWLTSWALQCERTLFPCPLFLILGVAPVSIAGSVWLGVRSGTMWWFVGAVLIAVSTIAVWLLFAAAAIF
jgi:hypothetical protein